MLENLQMCGFPVSKDLMWEITPTQPDRFLQWAWEMDKRKTEEVVYLTFIKALDTVFCSKQSSHRQTVEVWVRKVDSKVDWKLTKWLGLECGDQCQTVWMEHCTPGIDTGANSI